MAATACCNVASPSSKVGGAGVAGACCGSATGAACCGVKACSTPCSTAAGGCCDLSKMHLKFHYFNVAGRGELIRMMFAFAKAPFEDKRVSFADWPAMKSKFPTHQLPVLEYTDPKTGKETQILQSAAIIRAVAGFTGLAGKTPLESIEADQAFECLRDVAELAMEAYSEKDPARKEVLLKKVKTEVAPCIFGYLEKKIKENGGKHLTGDSFTYVDIAVATYWDTKKQLVPAEEMSTFENEYPCLTKLAKSVTDNHEIKEYLAKRPAPEKH